MEVWRDIEGYEGLYQVSNYGRVKSVARISPQNHLLRERIRKAETDKNGYQIVNLCKGGKVKLHKVHRLVGNAFLENLHNKPQINHIDGNKANNHVSNLEWCTGSENIRHAFEIGIKHGVAVSRYGETNSNCKVSDDDVNEIRRRRFEDAAKYAELANLFGIGKSQIARIIKGEQRKKGSRVYV